MNDMCIQAQKMGLEGIVFTEHVDLVPHDHQYGFFRPKEYLAEIDRNRRIFDNNLQVFAGIELGEIHRYRAQVQKIIDQENYDVVVGSLHWINDVLFYDPEFVRHRSAESVYLEYMEELCELCWTGGFDVLAHFDVVKRVLPKNHSVAAWPRVVEYMRDALRGMVKNQIALEINTWTVRNGMSETSAPGWLVSEFRRMGG
ncbi:MAG: PHP domain-containing protein, partial [Chloroflexota bacterium]